MSYILDALRRADSERERGAVPDIHAQPVPVVSDDADSEEEGRKSHPLVWVVLALSVALVASLLWQRSGLGEAVPPPQVSPPAPAVAALPAVVPPPPTATLPAPQPQPQDTAAVAPALVPAAPLQLPAEPAPAPSRAPAHEAAPAAAAATARAPAAQQPTPAPAQTPAQPDSGSSRIYARHELPGHIQRELPQISIGGSVYSEDASRRFVVINGSIVHEGDKPLPGLVLEQIKLKSAVLRYKDYRYEVAY